jgi:hypothetical protein
MPSYDYHASAVALGGVLKSGGVTTLVPSVASAKLAPTGGEGFTDIVNYHKDGVSMSNARSYVSGYKTGTNLYTTIADVYITNLNLFGRVQADILHTSVISTRVFDPTGEVLTEAEPDNSEFTLQATIRGLRIDDVEVIPQYDAQLIGCGTYKKFKDQVQGAPGYASRFEIDTADLDALLNKSLPVAGTFVEKLTVDETRGIRRSASGVKIRVPGFGKVHLGELVVKPGHRRVNLMRLDLDAFLTTEDPETPASPMMRNLVAFNTTNTPEEGSMTVVNVDGNGAPNWP